MHSKYDKYYQTENLFGSPYPELLAFYSALPNRGKLLDLGCGQGRDAIALARLGFEVTGLDRSEVGIAQLNAIASKERLSLKGITGDLYEYSSFHEFDFILMDSIFHFGKREWNKEMNFIQKLLREAKPNAQITICSRKTEKTMSSLNSIIRSYDKVKAVYQVELAYKYEDKLTNHRSESIYVMATLEKQ